MKFTDLGSPTPKVAPLKYEEFAYPVADWDYLPPPLEIAGQDFFEVVWNRISRRQFGPVSKNDLSALLWFSQKELQCRRRTDGSHSSHRPSASAGGCHPVDLLLTSKQGAGRAMQLYDPVAHALGSLGLRMDRQQSLMTLAEKVLDMQEGILIWLAVQPARTSSRYDRADSLVWRDIGVLMGHMLLVAEALGLSACPLGITGEPALSHALTSDGLVVGAGAIVVGSRVAV